VNAGGIPTYLDRKKVVWSFTNLNTYRNCPFQFQQRYITKAAPFVGNAKSEFGTYAHEAVERRACHQKIPLPDDLRYLESFVAPLDSLPAGVELFVEQQLGINSVGQACKFFADDVYIRGKIDVMMLDRQGQRALIWDWKTGSRWDNDPLELEVFACLVQKHFGVRQLDGQFIWLKQDERNRPGPGRVHPLSETAKTWTKVVRIINDIERDLARQTDFYKKQSPLCAHCSAHMCEYNPNGQSGVSRA
jgi:PD-(D/E)XK nuclease superfamily